MAFEAKPKGSLGDQSGEPMLDPGTIEGKFRPLAGTKGLDELSVPGNLGDENQSPRHDYDPSVAPYDPSVFPIIEGNFREIQLF